MKQKDPGAFTIPCVIGNASFKRALCDLCSSISVMHKHVYDSLSLEPLIKTSIVIQLVDRSFVYSLGVIEDVLIKIDSLVITCDFYILDMEHDSCDSSNNIPILFGRLFLKTANTKIYCGKDTLFMEVGDEKIEFNFHNAMKYPYNNVYFITCYDQVDKCVFILSLILKRCIETNIVLNYEKCYFMVEQGIVLRHIVSSHGLEVDKAKIDVISSLPYPSCVRKVHFFLGHAGFY